MLRAVFVVFAACLAMSAHAQTGALRDALPGPLNEAVDALDVDPETRDFCAASGLDALKTFNDLQANGRQIEALGILTDNYTKAFIDEEIYVCGLMTLVGSYDDVVDAAGRPDAGASVVMAFNLASANAVPFEADVYPDVMLASGAATYVYGMSEARALSSICLAARRDSGPAKEIVANWPGGADCQLSSQAPAAAETGGTWWGLRLIPDDVEVSDTPAPPEDQATLALAVVSPDQSAREPEIQPAAEPVVPQETSQEGGPDPATAPDEARDGEQVDGVDFAAEDPVDPVEDTATIDPEIDAATNDLAEPVLDTPSPEATLDPVEDVYLPLYDTIEASKLPDQPLPQTVASPDPDMRECTLFATEYLTAFGEKARLEEVFCRNNQNEFVQVSRRVGF